MVHNDDQLKQDLHESESPLAQVIRGHLWVESALIALLEAVLPFPEHVDLARFSFAQKLALATAHGFISPEDLPTYQRLNKIRNQLAHSLSSAVKEDDLRDLANSFGPVTRRIYDDYYSAPERTLGTWKQQLGTVLALLYIRLSTEHNRVATLNEQHRKSAAELREYLATDERARTIWEEVTGQTFDRSSTITNSSQ